LNSRKPFERNTGDPADANSIVARSGLPVPEVLSIVRVLEIRKLIQRLPGGSFCRR